MDLAKHFVRLRGVASLTAPEVAAHVGLSQDQKLSLASMQRLHRQLVRDRLRQQLQAGRHVRSVTQTLLGLTQETQRDLLTILTPEQRTRFERLVGPQ